MNGLPPPPVRLPVSPVVSRSFSFAWERRDSLILSYVVYAVVVSLATLIGDYGFGPGNSIGTYLTIAADQIFGVSLAVGLHRYILLNEPAHGLGFFRWDRNFVRYFLVSLVLGLSVLAVSMVFLNVAAAIVPPDFNPNAPAPGVGALSFLLLVGLIAIGTVLARVFLALPAAALGQKLPLGALWQATRSNGFRLLAVGLVVLLPFIVIELSLHGAGAAPELQGDAPAQVDIGADIALALLSPIERIVLTIMLALEYDVLFRGGGPRRE